jgi:hypothetical protein
VPTWPTSHTTTASRPPGEDLAKAVAYAVQAGDLEQLAPDAAVSWYEQALELHERVPGAGEPDRCDLLIKLGEAEAFAGLLSQRETLFEAAELARWLGDPQRLVRAAIANDRGTLYSKAGAVDQARVVMLEDALASLPPGESPESAELLARLSNELHFAGEPERPRALSDEALAVARGIDDPNALIRVVAERRSRSGRPTPCPSAGRRPRRPCGPDGARRLHSPASTPFAAASWRPSARRTWRRRRLTWLTHAPLSGAWRTLSPAGSPA